MPWYWLVIGLLATRRLSHLVAEEDGPGRVIARVRRRVGHGLLGTLMDCFQCLSLWAAAPIAMWIAERWADVPLLWIALSGGAILVDRLTTRDLDGRAEYFEHPQGGNHGVLRKGESGRASDAGDERSVN